MSDIGLEIKFDEFSSFCRTLADKLGEYVTLQNVIDFEVAKILEKTVANTGKADAQKIKKRVAGRAIFTIGSRKWYTKDWKTGQGWRVPDSVWALIEAKRARELARKLAKIGLSKSSWWLLAQKAGFIIEVPSFVASAHTSFEPIEGDLSVERQKGSGLYGIGIENQMPILRFDNVGGTQALYGAIAGRIGFFKQNLEKGVFRDIQAIASKYQGMLVEENELIGEEAPTIDQN